MADTAPPSARVSGDMNRRLQGFTANHLNELQEHELKLLALEMRRDRFSIARISRTLSLSAAVISEWIKTELSNCIALERLTAQEIVRLELEELDFLQSSLIDDINAGETQAVMAALRVAESRRKLLGLDKPDAVQAQIVIREIEGVVVDGPNSDI